MSPGSALRHHRPAARPRTLRALRATPRTGQAVVELAILLPVVLFILLGAIDFGRVFILTIQLQNAAREGAAYGSAKPTDTPGITTAARQELGGDTAVSVTVTCAAACATSTSATGNTVTVDVSRTFAFLTPLLGNLFGGPISPSMSATAVIQ